MKARAAILPFVLLVIIGVPAHAHFILAEPPEALVVNTSGDPVGTGGSQKVPPCGVGTTSTNKVTKIAPGSKLHLKIKETIKHGGHYRVALAANRADFKEPIPVVTANNCVSAPVENPPVAPVIADGLFPHLQADTIPAYWETDITLPNTPCPNCTLQVIEFMTPHAPQCFYHHCATLDIEADAPEGGTVIEDDDAGAAGTILPPADDGTSSTSDSASRARSNSDSSSGCSVGRMPPRSNAFVAYFALAASFAALRRARRRAA